MRSFDLQKINLNLDPAPDSKVKMNSDFLSSPAKVHAFDPRLFLV